MGQPKRSFASLALLLGVGIALVLVVARAALAHPGAAAQAKAPSAVQTRASARPASLLGEEQAMHEALVARLQETSAANAEASRSAAILAPAPAAAAAPAPWIWPLPGIITGPFGERRRNGPHPGLDINGRIGDPVVAAVTGTVIWSGPAPSGFGGYGNVVMVDVGNGIMTMYAHLSAWNVQQGQVIQPGDHVGNVGVSGIVTGPHLHFEVRLNNVPVDPQHYLPPR